MTTSNFSKSSAVLPPSVGKNPPPIPFVPKVKKMDKVYGPDADKSKWMKLDFLLNPKKSASKYSQQFSIFKDGYKVQRIG
jgi:hypothetical protein